MHATPPPTKKTWRPHVALITGGFGAPLGGGVCFLNFKIYFLRVGKKQKKKKKGLCWVVCWGLYSPGGKKEGGLLVYYYLFFFFLKKKLSGYHPVEYFVGRVKMPKSSPPGPKTLQPRPACVM
jgi:hypothetical protein